MRYDDSDRDAPRRYNDDGGRSNDRDRDAPRRFDDDRDRDRNGNDGGRGYGRDRNDDRDRDRGGNRDDRGYNHRDSDRGRRNDVDLGRRDDRDFGRPRDDSRDGRRDDRNGNDDGGGRGPSGNDNRRRDDDRNGNGGGGGRGPSRDDDRRFDRDRGGGGFADNGRNERDRDGGGRQDRRPDDNGGSNRFDDRGRGGGSGNGNGFGREPQRNGNGNSQLANRGGGGGFGGGGGGQPPFRGGGGSGGPRTTINASATEASANIICANVTNNFRFYHYGVDGSSSSGGMIESRRRKAELFNFGLFDEHQGLLARKGMSPKDIEDFRRNTFFEGSFVYTSRPIPFIKDLPFSLVGNKVPGSDAPLSDNGDKMTITSRNAFSAPETLVANPLKSSADGIVVDLRCADCTQAFKSKEAMFSHCESNGHKPVMDLDEALKPASTEQFIGFCNVALQRAMGERMARWGREYIDPKNWTEPTDRNGRSMGVRIFRAFVSKESTRSSYFGNSLLTQYSFQFDRLVSLVFTD